MPELEQLRADHASAVLAFETANRAYFAATIFDRGDAFFAEYPDRYRALLAEQEAGDCACYLLVAADGSVLGRFNLIDIADRTAKLGYRVAEHATGRGLATAAVERLCRLARTRHGLSALLAVVSTRNAASCRVLVKTGFTPVGPAGPADLGGKPGSWYRRGLEDLGGTGGVEGGPGPG
ncbi:GNAT family N-acetyltransferase [Kitasatospora cineracea]|uniref:GNAT family N-acetyltransferase n=1 Tax=Kitasatospora cineracea TaxID=88074 RepID=UPI003433F9AC